MLHTRGRVACRVLGFTRTRCIPRSQMVCEPTDAWKIEGRGANVDPRMSSCPILKRQRAEILMFSSSYHYMCMRCTLHPIRKGCVVSACAKEPCSQSMLQVHALHTGSPSTKYSLHLSAFTTIAINSRFDPRSPTPCCGIFPPFCANSSSEDSFR